MFGMIQSLFDALEVAAQKSGTHFASTTTWQFGSEDTKQHAANRLKELEQNIAGEAVTDHHIELTRQHITPLTVASEVQTRFLDQ